jgi:hypothetical protein
MSLDAEALYRLLPAIHRLRDAERGEPLKALVGVIAEQVAVLEENLDQLYDDQFIETCAEWVVPYIGELVGHRQLHGVTAAVQSPRAEVANTVALRRRKGTAAMLEQLAHDVTGWDARVVEFFQKLASTQYLNHLRPDHAVTVDLRRGAVLVRLGGAFDSLAHTADLRRVGSGGRYNIPNVGLFLWRLHAYPLTAVTASPVDPRRFRFDPLGVDRQLYNRPRTETSISQPAGPLNVPEPIGRGAFAADPAAYYGASLSIEGVGLERVDVCNLADSGDGWAHAPSGDRVAIDPLLGRIAFGSDQPEPPRVSFHYGFGADLGGGEYDRAVDPELQPVAAVPAVQATVQAALDSLDAGGAVEIGDNRSYRETLKLALPAGRRLELRAGSGLRPLLQLDGPFEVGGEGDGELILSGLVLSGESLKLVAAGSGLDRLRLSHCTLVPGRGLNPDGSPAQPGAPGLIVETAGTLVEIDHCILGGLRIAEGARVRVTDSIIDSNHPSGVAYAGLDGKAAGAPLEIRNSTVIGKIHAALLEEVSQCLLLAQLAPEDDWTVPVLAQRRQQGCVRFSYLPLSARVPRRYRCRPDSAEDPSAPLLVSQRYGDPGYCQLSRRTADAIRRGAEDGAEMGVFHDTFGPQRETNLKVRLEEYLRFGLEAGLIFES